MTNLIVFCDTLTAAEVEYGDNVRYIETFRDWAHLLATLSQWFDSYALIEIKAEWPKEGLLHS